MSTMTNKLSAPRADAPIDLSSLSPEALVYLLRHRELWPAGFVWDFERTDRCALNLFALFWDLPFKAVVRHFRNSKFYDLFFTTIWAHYRVAGIPIFPGVFRPFSSVTPDMVADAIEALPGH